MFSPCIRTNLETPSATGPTTLTSAESARSFSLNSSCSCNRAVWLPSEMTRRERRAAWAIGGRSFKCGIPATEAKRNFLARSESGTVNYESLPFTKRQKRPILIATFTPLGSAVVNYVRAMNHGLKRLSTLPVSVRLIREIHAELLQNVRGSHLTPGQLRTSQNWIGPAGCLLNEATFVPPPPHEVQNARS